MQKSKSKYVTWLWNNNTNNFKWRIVQAIENSLILLKGITKTIKYETRKKKGRFLGMLLGTLWASLLGTKLAGKDVVRTGYVNKQGKGK